MFIIFVFSMVPLQRNTLETLIDNDKLSIIELCIISIKMVEILQTIWTITLHGLEVKNCLLLFLLCIARMINGTVCIFSFELSGEILSP